MPTYEYQCQKCNYRFEEFQKITEPAIEKCPKCGGRVERLLGTGAGFLFKGSGFYITDYRSSEYKKKEKEEKGTSEKPAKTSSTDTEKPKTESKKEKNQ